MALANLIVSFTKAVASAARLNEVFALRSELVDGECEKAEAKAEAVKVKMEHVTFCYPGSQEPALEDISFTAKAGETIGIIGGTGSGKTTLVNLIPRFYDVTEGKAEIDGLEISKYRTASYLNSAGNVRFGADVIAVWVCFPRAASCCTNRVMSPEPESPNRV